MQYVTPCTDADATSDSKSDELRRVLDNVEVARCQGGPNPDLDNAVELLVLAPTALPAHHLTIIPVLGRSFAIVPGRNTHSINNLPMPGKRIVVYGMYMMLSVSHVSCVFANGNWVVEAVLVNGEKTLLVETTTNASAYVDRDAV